jgi:hypothetical protein
VPDARNLASIIRTNERLLFPVGDRKADSLRSAALRPSWPFRAVQDSPGSCHWRASHFPDRARPQILRPGTFRTLKMLNRGDGQWVGHPPYAKFLRFS